MDRSKDQPDSVATPDDIPPGVIVSPDTHRANRIPPGQSRTKKWPVLDAGGPPRVDLTRWQLRLTGLVNQPAAFTWQEFLDLPHTRVFSDFPLRHPLEPPRQYLGGRLDR